jgi:hypothetical protein
MRVLAEFKGKFCFSFTTKYQNWFPHVTTESDRDKNNTDMVHMDSGQPTPAQECKLQREINPNNHSRNIVFDNSDLNH